MGGLQEIHERHLSEQEAKINQLIQLSKFPKDGNMEIGARKLRPLDTQVVSKERSKRGSIQSRVSRFNMFQRHKLGSIQSGDSQLNASPTVDSGESSQPLNAMMMRSQLGSVE